jgi:hypothetical protein
MRTKYNEVFKDFVKVMPVKVKEQLNDKQVRICWETAIENIEWELGDNVSVGKFKSVIILEAVRCALYYYISILNLDIDKGKCAKIALKEANKSLKFVDKTIKQKCKTLNKIIL